MNYKFKDFKWMANMSGFNYPIDVHYGTIFLGTLVAKAEGFIIKMVDTPQGKLFINESSHNLFRSQNLAAAVLHRTWKTYRQPTPPEFGDETVPA
jgi:hypothetical protein